MTLSDEALALLDVNPILWVFLSLGAFRITRFITTDTLFEPVREKIWSKWPPSTKFGYFFTCNWCTGQWVAALAVISYLTFPDFTLVVSLILSISAIIGLISAWTDER